MYQGLPNPERRKKGKKKYIGTIVPFWGFQPYFFFFCKVVSGEWAKYGNPHKR